MTTVTVVSESALLDGPDRLVVSPVHGRLVVVEPAVFTTEGELVCRGHLLARIDSDGRTVDVRAPCNGWVMCYLARDGDRVEPGSPIAHVRAL